MKKSIIIACGVSGCGKSTYALREAKEHQGSLYIEADDFHTKEAKDKMASGVGIDDTDRVSWIDRILEAVEKAEQAQLYLACSCLKFIHRNQFREGLKDFKVEFVYLDVEKSILEERLASRVGHFAPLSLLSSQIASLELPDLSKEKDCSIVRI